MSYRRGELAAVQGATRGSWTVGPLESTHLQFHARRCQPDTRAASASARGGRQHERGAAAEHRDEYERTREWPHGGLMMLADAKEGVNS